MNRKIINTRHHKKNSDSSQSQQHEEDFTEFSGDLYKELKHALIQNDTKNINKIINSINKTYKDSVGIVRISLPESFTFNQSDIEQFFHKYGKIQNIILKQNYRHLQDQNINKIKQQQSIAYVIYMEYFSAVLAVKVLNSLEQKQRIINAKLCFTNFTTKTQQMLIQPFIDINKVNQMMIQVEQDYDFNSTILGNYKFIGCIGLDLTDKTYNLKDRILGIKGCNFIRIYYLCEKLFKFEHQDQQSRLDNLVLKLVNNIITGLNKDILVMSQSQHKYNQAIRYLHQLLQQIIQQYKNSRQKSIQIIPKDVHIKKWQKFVQQPHLKFVT